MTPLLQRLHSEGFVDLGRLDLNLSTAIVARQVAQKIGAAIIAEPEELKVSNQDAKRLNTYGGNYGHSALPLHTDLAHWHRPPRYLMLRCILGSPKVCTAVLHRRDLEYQIPQNLMKRAMFSPRRRLEGKMFLMHMLTDELFRWDELFLQPKNQSALEVRQRMLEVIPRLKVTNITLDHPGHTILIDNWHVLHGRSAVPDSETGRRIERIYMEEATNGH